MPRDLAGKRFGEWTVLIACGFDRHRRALWVCRCSCSVVRPILEYDLVTEGSTQCQACAAFKREARKRKAKEKA